MKQKKRFLSLLLCGTLVVSSLMQTTALADCPMERSLELVQKTLAYL